MYEYNAIFIEVERFEEWACVNLMRFNKAKCKVLYMVRGHPLFNFQYCPTLNLLATCRNDK